MKDYLIDKWDDLRDFGGARLMKGVAVAVLVYLIVVILLGWVWSWEPDEFSIQHAISAENLTPEQAAITGAHTTATLIHLGELLLEKNGGYISNDIFPPGLWMDNMPNWEFGVLVQIRDLSRAMRKDISRSQSQSTEDRDLVIAEPQYNFDSESWIIPATESEYRRANKALRSYLLRLTDPAQPNAQFYARADNLRNWLMDVETRLGSLSQRLSESVGKLQHNIDLAGDRDARQSTPTPEEQTLKTPWLEIDDVFYEARGTSYALIHLLKAIERDFKQVLQDKNAVVSLQQIITELEGTQETVWSPLILNGSGFGMMANHSLTMASYISRANAAIIDLRSLLAQG